MRQNRGYTLLEILLSLTIMAVLGSLFISMAQKAQERNQIRTAALQINAINRAAITYYKMYQEWPTTIPALSSLLSRDASCSVWKKASGCTLYQITSAANAHYFALAIATPNTVVAAHLVAQLPSSYQSGATVTSYITTFSGFKIQKQIPPPGILLSADSKQLQGICNTGSATNPFKNCISYTAAQPKPYGLIDINAQSKGSIVAQNIFAIMRGAGSVGATITSAAPTCPVGTVRTMMVLAAGVKMQPAGGHSINDFRYIGTGLNGYLQANFSAYISADKMSNVSAGVGDIVCLPINALKNWNYSR